jgi:hypothetical protein
MAPESDFPHRHFFPLRALIDSDLPSRRDIEAVFAVGGFAPVVHEVVTQALWREMDSNYRSPV